MPWPTEATSSIPVNDDSLDGRSPRPANSARIRWAVLLDRIYGVLPLLSNPILHTLCTLSQKMAAQYQGSHSPNSLSRNKCPARDSNPEPRFTLG